jgi:hypothetical protein
MSFFTATEFVFKRLKGGDYIGGVPEHWEITDPGGALVARVEENMSMLSRSGRFLLSGKFAWQQGHRLEIVDPAGGPLLTIVKPPQKLRQEHAEVRSPDGSARGTVRLAWPDTSSLPGLDFHDRGDARVGHARRAGHRAREIFRRYEVFSADGSPIGAYESPNPRLKRDPDGYRFQVTGALDEPLRSLVLAAPVVSYFIH